MIPSARKPAAIDDANAEPPASRGALGALSLATFLASLGTSIANVALPTLAQEFHARFEAVQWITLAYLLAVTCASVCVGRLGDLVGRRRLLGTGLALFTVASAACGLATELWILILARAAQGLGAAALLALALAFVSEAIPKARTGAAMGLLGTTSAIGTAAGPSLGGALIEHFGWQAIFLIDVPLGLLAALLAARCLPADRARPKLGRNEFDHTGAALLVLALAAYALATTHGRGHFGPVDVALLLAAAGAARLFIAAESRAASPLIPLATLRDPALRTSLAASAIVATVLMATLVVGPFYLTRTLGLDAGSLGLAMSAGPLVAALTGVPAGRIVDRFGSRRTSALGLAGIASGAALACAAPAWLGIPGYIGPVVVMTGAYALFQTANNTAVLRDVGPDRRGVVSGMLSLSRNLGLVTGTAVMGTVFAIASGADDVAMANAAEATAGMRVTFAVAALAIVAALALVTGIRAERTSPLATANAS